MSLSDKERKQIAQFLCRNARKRAKKLNIEHTLTWEDIDIPQCCPITLKPMHRNLGQQANNSYTLDRRDPKRGYVKGNVFVMSLEANRLKSDLDADALERLLEYMKG